MKIEINSLIIGILIGVCSFLIIDRFSSSTGRYQFGTEETIIIDTKTSVMYWFDKDKKLWEKFPSVKNSFKFEKWDKFGKN